MSPPMMFSLYASYQLLSATCRASTTSRKPGAKRSICASMASVMSSVERAGAWQ